MYLKTFIKHTFGGPGCSLPCLVSSKRFRFDPQKPTPAATSCCSQESRAEPGGSKKRARGLNMILKVIYLGFGRIYLCFGRIYVDFR